MPQRIWKALEILIECEKRLKKEENEAIAVCIEKCNKQKVNNLQEH